MKKLPLLLILGLLAFTQSVSATCYTGGSWNFNYCQNLTVYNNDTAYQIEANVTVGILFNHASLVSGAKSLSNGADLILAYGAQELARFNGTAFNNNSVPIFFNLPKPIPAGGKDSNYSFYYGDPTASLSSRNYNVSRVFYYAGDDFNYAAYNGSGIWNESAGTYYHNINTTGYLQIGDQNSSTWNIFIFNRTQGAFPSTNVSIMSRITGAGGTQATQYISGICSQSDMSGCGGIAHPAYGFRAGAALLQYGSDLAPSTDYTSTAGVYQLIDIRLEPVANRQQYWRGFNQTNPGNTTVTVTGWNPAWGVDGSTQSVDVLFDWIGVRKRTTINEPTVLPAAEDQKPQVGLIIYAPLNTTYRNGTTTPFIFSVNDTANSTSFPVWLHDNGVITNIGQIANGSTLTYTFNVTNGANNASVTAYTSAGGNSSATTYFTWLNGLNITAYNASQANTTYLSSVTINVSDGTNSTVTQLSTSPLELDTRNLTHGTVSVNAIKTGYATTNLTNYINSNASAYYNVLIPLWRHQEFKAIDASNSSSITGLTITLQQSSNSSSYSTSNGTIDVSLGSIPTGTVVVTFTATGYNTTNVSFNVNTSSEINYTLSMVRAGVVFYAYDESTCITTCQRIYFSFATTNGSSSGSDYNSNYFWNGTYSNSSLVQGSNTITFNNSVNGTYGNRNYFITISSTSAIVLNVYLLNTSSANYQDSVFCTITAANSPISGAQVTAQRFISGAYVTVGQVNTSADGCGTIGLDKTVTYQIVAAANGYNTQTFTTVPKTLQYIVMASSSTTPGYQQALADSSDYVIHQMLPHNPVIGDWVLVNYSIYSYNGTLTQWGLTCDYNNAQIYSTTVVGSPSGGTATTNVTTTNKTIGVGGLGFFNCSGFFDRSGYNTTYLNQTFFLFTINDTYKNISISGLVNFTIGANLSSQFKAASSVLATGVIMAGASKVPFLGGTGVAAIGALVLAGFGFLGWMDWRPILLAILVSLAWIWRKDR